MDNYVSAYSLQSLFSKHNRCNSVYLNWCDPVSNNLYGNGMFRILPRWKYMYVGLNRGFLLL